MTAPANYYLKGGKLHELHRVPFATVLKEVQGLQAWPYQTNFLLELPKIPYALFRQVCAWQRKIAEAHKCESTTSLFLVNGEWIAVPFFQHNTTGSMTADVDFTDERNAALLAKYADESDVHATIHNHVNGGASQSGRDSNDEKNLPGPHITIGHLSSVKLDWHARLSTSGSDGKHGFIQNLSFMDLIDVPFPPGPLKEETAKEMSEAWLTFKSSDEEIPPEWEERFEIRTYQRTTPSVTSTTTSSGQPSNGTLEKWLDDNKGELTPWPYGFLEHLDRSSREKFKESLMGALPTVVHAAYCVADHIAPNNPNGYVMLYQHLKEKFDKPAPVVAKTEGAIDPTAASTATN